MEHRQRQTSRQLLGRGPVYAIASAFQLVSVVLFLPALTRALEPAEFGAVVASIVVLRVLAVVAHIGLPAAITREAFSRAGDRGARRLVAVASIAAVLLSGAAAATATGWVDELGFERHHDVVLLAIAAAAPFAVALCCQALLQARDAVAHYLVVAALGSLLGPAVGLSLVAATDTPSAFVGGILVGYVCAAAAGLAFVRPALPRSQDRRFIRGALAVALPTLPHSLALYVIAAVDRLVIGRIDGLPAAGRYDVAYTIGTLPLVLLVAINMAWAPIVYGAPEESRWETLASATRTVRHVVFVLGAGVALAIGLPVAVIAPPEYDHAEIGRLAGLLVLTVVPYVTYLANVHVLFQRRRTTPLAWITPTAAIVNIAACLMLVPTFGLTGGAVATLAAYVFQAAAVRWAARGLADVPRDRADFVAYAALFSAVAISVVTPQAGLWAVARLVAAGLLVAVTVGRFGRNLRGVTA